MSTTRAKQAPSSTTRLEKARRARPSRRGRCAGKGDSRTPSTSVAGTNSNAMAKPKAAGQPATPWPPSTTPANFPADMMPLARLRSFGASRSMASASVPTSWAAAIRLCRKSRAENSGRSAIGFANAMASKLSAMPASASRMKGRRRPSRPKESRSTSRPSTGLPAQGSQATNIRSPSPAGDRPSEVRRKAMATVKKPQGTPWAK